MPASPVCVITSSPAATDVVAAAVARACRPGDVVVLAGEMGAGKTSFAKGFGAALGVTEPITSPTFTLVQTYEAMWSGRPLLLHHADIYRLDQLSEVADLAFGELAEFGGVLLVEWGDVVAATLGDHLLVRLEPADVDSDPGDSGTGNDDDPVTSSRRITIVSVGSAWASRWEQLGRELAAGADGVRPC